MAAASTRIVSLTITEGGYNVEDGGASGPNRGGLAELPETAFGLVTEALGRGRERGVAPFTVMSCDNLEGNGGSVRMAFSAFARCGRRARRVGRARGALPELDGRPHHPGTTEADIAEVRKRFGIDDRWPVVCEPYTAMGARGRISRPDARPTRTRGCRSSTTSALRADEAAAAQRGHQAMSTSLPGGYRLVHDAAQDPLFRAFLLAATWTRRPPRRSRRCRGSTSPSYKRTLIERFSNPEVRDTLAPPVRRELRPDPEVAAPRRPPASSRRRRDQHCAAVVASWARYAEGIDEQGEPIDVVDRLEDGSTRSPDDSARIPTRSSRTASSSATSSTTTLRRRRIAPR